jgi:hypothetical protein
MVAVEGIPVDDEVPRVPEEAIESIDQVPVALLHPSSTRVVHDAA